MRVAVLGLGSIGSRHARNLVSLGHQVFGFDPRPPAADERWERAAAAEDAVRGADAVVVASPTSLHAEHALLALEHGSPTLVEKPLAMNGTGAARVAAAARERGLVCGVAMNLRFHPAVRALRGLLSDGTIGEVSYAQASAGSDLRGWRPGTDYRTSYSARAELGGGVVRDAIHELDYLTWLLGPVESVTAETARVSDLEIDVEDLALALLRFRSGALGSVDLTYVDPVYRRGCLLVGTRASARWDWVSQTIEVAAADSTRHTIHVPAEVADTYLEEMRDFLAAVQNGRAPLTPVQEGEQVVRLADAVLLSAAAGRRVTP